MAAAHKVSSLLDWCESLDGQVPARVAFKAIAQQGVGGVAQQAIASTDVVLEIPVDCVITANTARSDKEVGLAIRAVDRVLRNKQSSGLRSWSDDQINNALLVVYLAYQRSLGERSNWKAYVDALPVTYSSLMWYTDAQLILLEETPIIRELAGFRASFDRIHAEVIPALLNTEPPKTPSGADPSPTSDTRVPTAPEGFTEELLREHLLWAYSAFWSRALCVPVNSMQTPAMVPVLDLLNHRPGTLTEIKARTRREADKKTKILSLTCGYRIAKGEQVCIDYGPKGNGDLLLHFGFALENNIADIYTLYYTHKGTGPSASNDTPAKVSKFRLFRGDVLPLELLNAARITVADERERETLRKRKRGVEVDFALIDSVYGTEAREFIQQNDWGHAYNSLSDSRPTDDEVAESVTTTDTWDVYDVGEIISQANEEKALLHIQALLKTEHARLPTRRPIGRSINIPNAYSYDTMEDPRTVDTETHHMDAREASVSWEDAAYCTSVYIEGLHCILDDVQRNVQRLMTHLRSD